MTPCGGVCVSTKQSPTNCGACGVVCGGGAVCTLGACACGGGLSYCGGKCVNEKADEANCGACGVVCGPKQKCQNAQCK
jgi:hypothetical protein